MFYYNVLLYIYIYALYIILNNIMLFYIFSITHTYIFRSKYYTVVKKKFG